MPEWLQFAGPFSVGFLVASLLWALATEQRG